MGRVDSAGRVMKAKTIAYWATTVILVASLIAGGAAQLVRRAANVQGVTHLGYPAYVTTILGFWKVLGTIVLLAPRFPRLKEWVYAGVFFELTGAAASYAFHGDSIGRMIGPLALAVLALVSWALRPPARTVTVATT